MALNKYMHPRNVYKNKKPNFKELAEKYEEFRKYSESDERGRVLIDFKKPECLRALSWALLKDDFDLDVLMPLDRLIPTIPLRLNYILWLEDILNTHSENIHGIDIGTGASCVYPLLGAKKNSWKFLATESDATNYQYAKKNVENNQLADKIQVLQVHEGATLHDILSENSDTYDFSMCNPPFYGSNFEAWGMLTSRSDSRPEPSSMSTASPVECIVPGGEVQFTKQMISDSVLLKDRIRIYTTMLGKKSSISLLKEDLKQNGITNFSTTEFCQGKTMRWGLGWSFDDNVAFPKPPSKAVKAQKPRPPLVYKIPKQSQINLYTLEGATERMLNIFHELQISVSEINQAKRQRSFIITAVSNTWSHQRRKRRQQKKQDGTMLDSSKSSDSGMEEKHNPGSTAEIEVPAEDLKSEMNPDAVEGSKKLKLSNCEQRTGEDAFQPQGTDENNTKVPEASINQHENDGETCADVEGKTNICHATLIPDASICHPTADDSPDAQNRSNVIHENLPSLPDKSKNKMPSLSSSSDETILFSASVTILLKADDDIVMELQWLKGQSREAMHQVLQYIKNKLD